jgi:hypothetical protein
MSDKNPKPWAKVRGLKDFEWKRDTDEDIQNPEKRRKVNAVFEYVEIGKLVYDYQVKPGREAIQTWYDEAVFREEDGIKEYTIARRLVKGFSNGDHVILEVGGCCTVLGVAPKQEIR